MKKILLAVVWGFLAVTCPAAVPSDIQLLEAEAMSCPSGSWVPRAHYPNWYASRPSGRYHLAGYNRKTGAATGSIRVLKPGKHHLWVRYLDLSMHRKKCGFSVTVMQQGKELARKEFDREEASLRKTAAGRKRWGSGYANFVWDCMAVDIPAAGKLELSLEKLHAVVQTKSCGRHLDLFLLTQDLSYEPRIMDLHPWYFRIRMLPEQKTPVAIHMFGRKSYNCRGYYMNHSNTNRKGRFIGINKGAGDMTEDHFQAGDVSAWYDITDELTFGGRDSMRFSVITSYFKARPTEAFFEIQFSNTPSEEGLRATYARRGSGNLLAVVINSYENLITSEIEESGENLQRAKTAGAVAGPYARLYPLATGMAVSPAAYMQETCRREQETMKQIGINALPAKADAEAKDFPWLWTENMYFYLTRVEKAGGRCYQQPKTALIQQSMDRMVRNLQKNQQLDRIRMVMMMDEPSLPAPHVVKCPYCRSRFQDYLKQQKVTLSGNPTDKPEDGLRYYWTMRYRNHIMTELLRTGSRAVQKHFPGAPATVNFATELIGGNLVRCGCDWFEILDSDALSYAWSEDWANFRKTYQVAGYYDSVLRAACRSRGRKFGMYDILGGRSEWDIQAKAYTHMGNGADCIFFFNYGPGYTGAPDVNDARPEIYRAIAEISRITATAEKILVRAQPVQGDGAQLLSVTGDIWNQKRGDYFGLERVYLNLLFRHCNYRLDTVREQELGTTLKKYRLLVVNDSHLLQSQLQPLLDWIGGGGTLLLGPGALERNEADQPLGFDSRTGLQRQPIQMKQAPGNIDLNLGYRKVLGRYQNMDFVCVRQDPLYQVVPYRKGRIISLGFFPGLSYIRSAVRPDPKAYSILNYPEAHRNFIRKLPLPVKPSVRTDNHRIEAYRLQAGPETLIVLSNWTGRPAEVTVSLAADEKFSGITPGGVRILSQEKTGKGLRVRVRVAAGGFIVCR